MILYIVILVSVMDMFAYLGGKLLGKNKIIPKISKGKTIEGTIIGLLFIIVMSLLIKDLMNFNITSSVIYGLMIGVLAFFGDLIEFFSSVTGCSKRGNNHFLFWDSRTSRI